MKSRSFRLLPDVGGALTRCPDRDGALPRRPNLGGAVVGPTVGPSAQRGLAHDLPSRQGHEDEKRGVFSEPVQLIMDRPGFRVECRSWLRPRHGRSRGSLPRRPRSPGGRQPWLRNRSPVTVGLLDAPREFDVVERTPTRNGQPSSHPAMGAQLAVGRSPLEGERPRSGGDPNLLDHGLLPRSSVPSATAWRLGSGGDPVGAVRRVRRGGGDLRGLRSHVPVGGSAGDPSGR